MGNGNVAKILKLVISLTVISVIAGGGLALTYAMTEKQIAKQAAEEETKSNKEAFPEAKNSSNFIARDDLTRKVHNEDKDVQKVYEVNVEGKRIGWVVQVAPRGYGGPIVFDVGINKKGEIVGISVISIKETPGLGQNVMEPGFTRQFIGKMANDDLEVGKDIDGLTGATISSNALALGVKKALKAAEMLGGN